MGDTAVTRWSATAMARAIAAGDVSAAEVVAAHIARIERVDPLINAVVVRRFDAARAEAAAADAARRRGDPCGPLHGVPVTIKESLDLAGTASTFGLRWRSRLHAEADDAYVAAWRRAGAIVLGKTNVAQCLLYYESDNPVYGRTLNPWNPQRTCGGSSGGEGAVVAACGSPLGLGNDIGGSVRIPAAFCGIAGIKPTACRTPDAGRFSIPIGQRAVVSQVGVLARDVDDVALGLSVIDSARPAGSNPIGNPRDVDVARLRVAVYTDDGTMAVSPAVARAVRTAADALRACGADVFEWAPPSVPEAVRLYFGLLSGDGGRGLRAAARGEALDHRIAALAWVAGMSPPMRAAARALLGLSGQPTLREFVGCFGHTSVQAHWDLAAAQHDYRQRIAAGLDAAGIDVIVCPPCALPAYRHGASRDLGVAGGYAVLWNLLGNPAGVVPVGRVADDEANGRAHSRDRVEQAARRVELGSAGLPVAAQIVGRPWQDHVVLAAMRAVQTKLSGRADYPHWVMPGT